MEKETFFSSYKQCHKLQGLCLSRLTIHSHISLNQFLWYSTKSSYICWSWSPPLSRYERLIFALPLVLWILYYWHIDSKRTLQICHRMFLNRITHNYVHQYSKSIRVLTGYTLHMTSSLIIHLYHNKTPFQGIEATLIHYIFVGF